MKHFLSTQILFTLPIVVLSQTINTGVNEWDKKIGFRVRLTDGTASSGRVEVKLGTGEWGTVCLDGFDDLAATVVCRQMKYSWGNVLPAKDNFGVGRGPIHMDDLKCRGTELSLINCLYKQWGENNCKHSEDAAVSCTNKTVQLRNGGENHGVVYTLEDNNKWAVLCGKGFSQQGALVVCRQLGFQNGVVMPSGTYGNIEKYQGNFVRPNIQCMGTETDIQSCGFFGECSDNQYNYASVICLNGPVDKGISLSISGYSKTSSLITGVVEVRLAGVNGSVCGSHWDDNDADVVCRSQGYRGGIAYHVNPQNAKTPYVLGAVNCVGNENSLHLCPLGETKCTTTGNMKVAGVLCHSGNSRPTLRLVEEATHNKRLEIEIDGEVGGICDDQWFSVDAGVACRQLGYADGDSVRGLTAPYSRKYMSNIQCVSDEKTIFECPNGGWEISNSYCAGNQSFAGVHCYPHAFLANEQRSALSKSGSPLVFNEGKWYQICDRGFDYKEANLVCRELGFTNGVPLISQPVEERNNFRVFFAVLNCSEAKKIQDCEANVVSTCQTEFLNPSAYATVLCINETTAQANVKVYPPSGISSPVVELFGLNGTICASGWDDRDATVYCKEFGYTEGHASSNKSYVGEYIHNPVVWMTDMNCSANGTEHSIRSCASTLSKGKGPCTRGVALVWCK